MSEKDGKILKANRGGLTLSRQPSARCSMNLLGRSDWSSGDLI
jgi:hypothetical protein